MICACKQNNQQHQLKQLFSEIFETGEIFVQTEQGRIETGVVVLFWASCLNSGCFLTPLCLLQCSFLV